MINVPFVDLKAQYVTIRDEISAAIGECLENTAFVQGKRSKAFEEAFAAYLGVRHVLACSNGTDAIYLALKALGIGPGDEVVTAANTFIATAEAISMTGARVVFVDVDPVSNNMLPQDAERKVTPKTRALLPVHLYGHPADLDGFRRLADRHGLFLVGDAAQAHGAKIAGRDVAQLADITAYSFYPGKNLGAYGDAGAVATDNPEFAEFIYKFRDHGCREKYVHEIEGVNMRIDELQGAILNVKLPHLDSWTAARRGHAQAYTRNLAGVGDLVLPVEAENVRAVYHLYVVETARRDELMAFLRENGVATGIHYPVPLHEQPAYRHLGMKPEDCPVASAKGRRIMSLPMFAELTDTQIEYVTGKIREFFG